MVNSSASTTRELVEPGPGSRGRIKRFSRYNRAVGVRCKVRAKARKQESNIAMHLVEAKKNVGRIPLQCPRFMCAILNAIKQQYNEEVRGGESLTGFAPLVLGCIFIRKVFGVVFRVPAGS